jgi:hypothetical protein
VTKDVDQRFWEKVLLEDKIFPENGCMIWTGGKDLDGYAKFWDGSKVVKAARWIYERMIGPIPIGLILDHLCRVHGCVNPNHLEPVTYGINNERGFSGYNFKKQVPKTHCKHGHEFSEENTYVYLRDGSPRRACRACRQDNKRRFRKKKWYGESKSKETDTKADGRRSATHDGTTTASSGPASTGSESCQQEISSSCQTSQG